MATAVQWENDLNRRVFGAVENTFIDRKKELLNLAARQIVIRTPVDTGRMKASWSYSTGTPDPTPPDRAPGFPSLATMQAAIERDNSLAPGFIQNGVPYAEAIEDGHSGQAPDGVIGPTVDALS